MTIDKDDCAFSVVYSLLKIKSKAYIFENIFTIFTRGTIILLFTSAITLAFAECRRELESLNGERKKFSKT